MDPTINPSTLPKAPFFFIRDAEFRIPPYFPYGHPETSWIINMLISDNWDRIKRMITFNPAYFRYSYFQIPDRPVDHKPAYHHVAVLYLNVLSLALYLKNDDMVDRLCSTLDRDGNAVVNANDMIYVSNVYVRSYANTDLLVLYPIAILVRRDCPKSISSLLKIGWQPHINIVLPYRRAYRTVCFHFRDFFDFALAQLWNRIGLRIPHIFCILFKQHNSTLFNAFSYEKVMANYRGKEVEDWLSLPRRLLRFAYYYDLNMRCCSAVMLSLMVFHNERCFMFPTRSLYEIDISSRLKYIPSKSGGCSAGERRDRVLFDQDNCIALLLALLDRSIQTHSYQARDKIIHFTLKLLADTKWLLHFVGIPSNFLAQYFNSLIEEVDIHKSAVDYIVDNVYPAIEIQQLNDYALEDLHIPGGIKSGKWRIAIEDFRQYYLQQLQK